MSRRKGLRLAIFILVSIFCMGCKSEDEDTVTITVIHAWGGTEADHGAMRDIYQDFQKENPDINVQFIAMPTRDEMLGKVEDMIMVGNVPDIVDFGGMGENNIYHFMEENDMLVDIMPYLDEDSSFADCLSEANLKYWTVNGQNLYNISDVISLSGGYWYNKDIISSAGIEKMPETWEEFFTMCDKIQSWAQSKDNGVRPLQPSAEGYLYFMDHMLADSMGDYRFSLNNHLNSFSDASLELALDQIDKAFVYTSIEGTEYSYRDETSLFNQGQIALYVNGVWGASMISDNLDAAYALLPTESGVSTSCQSACLGYVVGNNNDSARQEAAIRFVKYMLKPETQLRIFEETGQIPADFENLISSYKDSQPRICKAAETVLRADKKIEVTDNFWSASQKDEIADSLVDMLSGKISRDEMKEILKK